MSAPANSVGGQAHAAADIVEGFAGHPDVSVRLVPIDPQLPGVFGALTRWKGVRSLVKPILYVASLLRHAPESDVFHVFAAAHTAFLFGAVPAVIVGRVFRRPIVLNYHDGRAASHLRWWGPLVRWVVRRCDRVVVPSGYLVEILGRHEIVASVVPNVVDTEAFTGGMDGPPPPRLVSVRALEDLYGIDNILRAFPMIRQEFPDVTCDIYGDGSKRADLEALAKRIDAGAIRFHGQVARQSVPGILAKGGVLVNSSRVDNMPHVIIEGFAAGIPIVSTDVGGIPYMVEDGTNALLVPPDQPNDLAAAVINVLRNPALSRSLVRHGRRESARYSWASARDLWIEVYDSAVAGRL